jgi:hypothetical protein
MKRIAMLIVAAALWSGATPLFAASITYTEVVTATGTLGLSNFTNALVTLVVSGNTNNVVNVGPGLFRSGAGSATVNISGLGTANFTSDVQAVSNQLNLVGGIADFTSGLGVLLTSNPAFATYALQTSLAAASGPALANTSTPFSTTAGNFTLNSFSGNSTFSATLLTSSVPEPASVTMLLTSIVGLSILHLRRKRI